MIFEDKTFVLGVGAQKAGTTWLHEYFQARGDIYVPDRKEMHYFSRKYRPDLYGKRAARRLTKFGNGGNGPAQNGEGPYVHFFRKRVPDEVGHFGEITPAYAMIGEAGFREIRSLFRNLRIIFIMRDPVERYYSQMKYANLRRGKNRPAEVSTEMHLRRPLQNPRFAERSQYELTIRALEKVFEPHEIVYLFYETLFHDESIMLLCDRLGICYRPADFVRFVNSTNTPGAVPGPVFAELREKFDRTYEFCRDKFGSNVPSGWHAGRE